MKRGTPSHPKTAALAELLGVDRWGAVGVLESLWHFAGQYARRGDIGRHKDLAIARGIDWKGDPEKLVQALIEAGWVDRCECHRLRIHDWKDHADQAVTRTKDVMASGFLECYLQQSSSEQLAAVQPPPASGFRLPANGTGLPADGEASTAKREAYVREVWAAWCVKRGGQLPDAGPTEVALMHELDQDGVPLRIALRAIADCSKPPRGPSTPLQYVEPAFHEAARHWRRSQTA